MPREKDADGGPLLAALEVLVKVLKALLAAAVFAVIAAVFLAQFLPEPHGAMFRRWMESIAQCPSSK